MAPFVSLRSPRVSLGGIAADPLRVDVNPDPAVYVDAYPSGYGFAKLENPVAWHGSLVRFRFGGARQPEVQATEVGGGVAGLQARLTEDQLKRETEISFTNKQVSLPVFVYPFFSCIWCLFCPVNLLFPVFFIPLVSWIVQPAFCIMNSV